MQIKEHFPHIITLSLLVLSAAYRSPAFGYASVVALGIILADQFISARLAQLGQKPGISDELKRSIQDINARLTTVEYGIRTRGF